MKKGLFITGLAIPTLVFATSIKENYEVHILQENETLSELLQSKRYKPLYGPGNWVEKVLDMNHLSADQAGKIKKGYPIILPFRYSPIAKSKTDTVSTKQASTVFYGLVGNKISNHQDVYIDISFFERSAKVANYNIKQQSNIKIGLSYEDQNKRTFNSFTYRPEFSIYGIGHGPTEFTNIGNTSASFEPTLQAHAGLMLNHKKVDYDFGPYAELLEQSSLDNINDNIEVRRDRFINIGAQARKVFEKNNLLYIVKGSIGTTLISDNLNNVDQMQMVTSKFSTDVNLTRDYFIGGFWRSDFFSNSSQRNATAFGLNLKYFVK